MLRICWNYRLFHFWASIRIIPVKFIGHRIFSRKTSTGSASSTLSSIPYRSILWLTFSPIRKSHPFPGFCLWWLSGKTWYPQQRYSPTRYRNCVRFQALFSSLPCRQCRWYPRKTDKFIMKTRGNSDIQSDRASSSICLKIRQSVGSDSTLFNSIPKDRYNQVALAESNYAGSCYIPAQSVEYYKQKNIFQSMPIVSLACPAAVQYWFHNFFSGVSLYCHNGRQHLSF